MPAMTAPRDNGATSQISIATLTVEHLREPLGIGTPRPRLSWTAQTAVQGWTQTAYEIEVADPDGTSSVRTGQVDSAGSVLVPWPAADLISRERKRVRVRVWGTGGVDSAWSDWLQLEAGLLHPGDWHARAVSPPLSLHGA